MRGSRSPARFRRARCAVLIAVVPAALAAAALAQSSNPFGIPQRPSQPATPQRPPQAAPAPAAGSPAVARVGGRVITQTDFDRVAQPYFQTLQAQLGAGFTADIRKLATFNVLDELIRRELLALEAQRQSVAVSDVDVDAILKQDPFFLTDGKFDPTKLTRYKTDPGSNYLTVLPRVREMAAIGKLDASLRKRFTPTTAQLEAEWARRNDKVRFKMLPLLTRDMPLEPEATEAEWAEYYRAHPDQFMRKTRARLRYVRLPLPAEGDSTRPASEAVALARARDIADSLRQGTMPDSAALLTDSGLFDITSPSIPGLGRVAGLSDTLGRLDQDSTIRVVGPYAARDAVIVGLIAERQPRHLPPMRDVLGEVKRRADVEKRRVAAEADRRAFYEAGRERWRGPRAALTRVNLDPATLAVKAPTPAEVEGWYAQHGRSLFGVPDSSKAWFPPLNDSLRAVAAARWTAEQRLRRVGEVMGRMVPALRTAKDARAAAKAHGAAAETLSFTRTSAPDSLFPAAFVDSLLTSAAATRGTLQGPREFGRHWSVWRVDAVDTMHVPPYEAVKARSDQEFATDRRVKEEADGRAYLEQHREDFKTPVRYALDCIGVAIPPPDSVRITEAEVRRRYDANRDSYRQDEQVKVRHILFMTRDAAKDVEQKAKARADSLLAAIRKDGGDFAELAKRFSQEPGAPTSGGDLGWFGRGAMVREFETAAFALKPGEISPVVKTQFGYHILKLEDRRAAGLRPFDEVRAEIRTQMAQARGDSTARRAANALRRRLAGGAAPGPLAARHGGVMALSPVAVNDPLPGFGTAQGLGPALPAIKPGTWAPDIYRAGARYVVVRVRERIPQRPAEFEEVKTQAIEAMKGSRRRAALEARVAALRASLSAGATLDSLAAPYGGLKDSGPIGQVTGFVPLLGNEPRVVARAATMTPGVVSDTVQVAQGVIWMRVEERIPADPAAFKAAAPQLEAELAKQRYDEWLEARKKAVKIEVLRADLKGPRPAQNRPVTISAG